MTLSDVENYLPCIVGSEVVNKTGVWILYSRYNTYQSTEDGQQEDRVTMAIAMRPGKYNELEIRKKNPLQTMQSAPIFCFDRQPSQETFSRISQIYVCYYMLM